MENKLKDQKVEKISFQDFQAEVLHDYQVACTSREASLLGRKEVLTGKAKFGIFGDGKEVAQIAMAKVFQEGDFRSGYYRDQTFMFASGMSNVQNFFAQLYANPDVQEEPSSAGRQMNGHYATRLLDEQGEWNNLTASKNCSSDISPTAGQMVRGLGLAFASKLFRNQESLKHLSQFSNNGNEVCFTTIGDASTSEGLFWETVNAATVLKVPLAIFCWDDGYGISVPRKFQTSKNSISDALAGFQYDEKKGGLEIYTVKGWDYASLCETFKEGIEKVRKNHIPALFHVQEITQPQGHSTSGSHERYKSKERLDWEKEMDCIKKMREFILENAIATESELDVIEAKCKSDVQDAKKNAWTQFSNPIKKQIEETLAFCNALINEGNPYSDQIRGLVQELSAIREPLRRDVMKCLAKVMLYTQDTTAAQQLKSYYQHLKEDAYEKYSSVLHSVSKYQIGKVAEVKPVYNEEPLQLNGFEILNKFFDHTLSTNPLVFAFGEDVGNIGDVNQGFAGLQQKHGKWRVFDTGIREASIMGQGIGMAMRGLRPIAEIQYLDYLLYGLQPLSDDVATLQYRTKGGQKCPLIVRTRGHRLEGVWHSGSPMGMMINSLRGIHICVPRNMIQAVGMYNTLLKSDEPAIVVECLNGYRLKENMPNNLYEMTIPLGVPEVIAQGEDITIVSYGSTLRIIQDAMKEYLIPAGISCELIDVQTLLPFDINHHIIESLKKTNRILFVDEDVPGGASAYMFQQVMELQGGYKWLDVAPRTISAQAHRPAYGSDGDYFSKPNAEDIAQVVKEMMHE
ncbi:MAG: transketolase [Bacteroidetes bacterium]|jgi:pyruvate/2-oxoglutarate/acetoin dehydrogenase E1 component/TPP-dependent pyruvate/acetoin dehydrogenase alpha subunit|nr:transketolase [Bacteroidota bacterium]MBK9483227.1 transketolase [Bacteroidota bacterium]HQW46195.1 thiamine pyrophosphate-dependent enzyme [Chitinophagaceae bacterium]